MRLFVLIKSTISWFLVEYFGIQVFVGQKGVQSSEGEKAGPDGVCD